ncbi:helix-turn-helix domain-containing protein [Rheinheimera riviphila]|nr:AraC family transcriptional regulator [Rheinheimera riviphila]
MKLQFEKIITEPGQSWRFYHYCWPAIELNWHCHPEYELVLTCNSTGNRFVGTSTETYQDNDLVLLGPYLPHGWQSQAAIDGVTGQHHAYVLQLPGLWLEQWLQLNPALQRLQKLLTLAKAGACFSAEITAQVKPLVLQLEQDDVMTRQIRLLQILVLLSQDEQVQRLTVPDNIEPDKISSQRKIDKIINYIHQNLMEDLSAAKLAGIVHMSTNHLHRFFRQKTEMTITQYVIQLRIERACDHLLKTSWSVEMIAGKCGFFSMANFNRQFLKLKKMTPRQYRQSDLRQLHQLALRGNQTI